MKTYYDFPTQVIFYDGGDDESPIFCTGIAYKDEIICACCGGVMKISEVIADAKEDGIKTAIYDYADWCDVRKAIAGGEYPEEYYDDYPDDDDEEA